MAELPTTPRGTATRRRILDAAAAEFASHGIAGARVDRVVRAASTNKAQLYAYFGNKDGLFDAVFAEHVDELTEGVPFTAGDLGGWAAQLYDEYLRRPDLVRLATWSRLERTRTGPLAPDTSRHDAVKTAAIVRAQSEGRVCAGDPADILSMVIAMSLAWSPASTTFTAGTDEPQSTHERRRTFLREWVTRATTPR